MNSNFGPQKNAPAQTPPGRGLVVEAGAARRVAKSGSARKPGAENSPPRRWRNSDDMVLGLAELHSRLEVVRGLEAESRREEALAIIAALGPKVIAAIQCLQAYERENLFRAVSVAGGRSIDDPAFNVGDIAADSAVFQEPQEEVSEATPAGVSAALSELFVNCGTGKRTPGVRECVFYILGAAVVLGVGPFRGLDPREVSRQMNKFAWDEKQIRLAMQRFCERTNSRYAFSRKHSLRGQNGRRILDPESSRHAA